MFAEITTFTVVALVLASFSAGFIDAVAGGGGLIQLPALLIGLPSATTAQVLGTNKSVSIVGTSASALIFRRTVKSESSFILAMAIPAFAGSLLGAQSASHIPTSSMRPIIFILLIGVAIYTWMRPSLGEIELLKHDPRIRRKIGAATGLVIGFYDGIFGPGTGSFLLLALVSMGFAFLSASAIAKVVNVSTNLAAVIVFGIHGVILWKIASLLALSNLAGGIFGARVAVKGGSPLIRKVFLFVTIALIFKVGLDVLTSW